MFYHKQNKGGYNTGNFDILNHFRPFFALNLVESRWFSSENGLFFEFHSFN